MAISYVATHHTVGDGGDIPHRVMRQGLSEEVAVEQRAEYREGASHVKQKSVPDVGESKVQDFKVGILPGSEESLKSRVDTIEEQGQKQDEIR